MLAYAKHRATSRIIAGPGFLDYKGGVFNPGALAIDDGETLLLAKGQACHWADAVSDKSSFNHYLQGNPVVITLDDHLELKSSYAIGVLDNFSLQRDQAIEDFRIFSFNSEVWVNHVLIPIERDGARRIGYEACEQAISVLDPDRKSLTFLGKPKLDFAPNRKEKNWVYLENNGELYLFYSFYPYRVLKLVDASTLAFNTVLNQSPGSRMGDIGGFGTLVSFSTNPVAYDDQYWLLLVHQVDASNKRLYYHWGVLIDKLSFKPASITSTPLFTGWGALGRLNGICYVMSVVARKTDFVFFCGEGDEYLTRMIVSRRKLERMWSAL